MVVTGIGALTPIGLSAPAFWKSLIDGVSGSAPITNFDASEFDTQFACELKDFDPTDFIERKAVSRQDPFSQYAVIAAEEAVRDAGVNHWAPSEREPVGVAFGSGIGGLQTFHEQTERLVKHGHRRISPFFIPKLIPDIASGVIAIRNGFKGPNYCVVSACATGNNNIGDAYMLVRQGYTKTMLCGGAEAPICELGVGGFNAMRALSTRNDSPETASRPFDATRDGFVLGEGAGALVLEELEHARSRGARIYAEVVGLGLSADAYHVTAPDPEGAGARLAMEMMLRDAGVEASDVDYVNMHGTSTQLGDIAESLAIKSVFGDHAKRMNLSSTKSMTGHLLGAAGAVEAIATLLAVHHDQIPPTINYNTPDEACDLNYTVNKAVKTAVNVAASNAFGFGGHNTTVAFGKYTED